jgi:hypothetical protein
MNWAGYPAHPTKWIIYFLEVPYFLPMPYDASCYPAGSPSGLQSPAEGNPPAVLSHRPPLRLQRRKPQQTVQRHLRDCRALLARAQWLLKSGNHEWQFLTGETPKIRTASPRDCPPQRTGSPMPYLNEESFILTFPTYIQNIAI